MKKLWISPAVALAFFAATFFLSAAIFIQISLVALVLLSLWILFCSRKNQLALLGYLAGFLTAFALLEVYGIWFAPRRDSELSWFASFGPLLPLWAGIFLSHLASLWPATRKKLFLALLLPLWFVSAAEIGISIVFSLSCSYEVVHAERIPGSWFTAVEKRIECPLSRDSRQLSLHWPFLPFPIDNLATVFVHDSEFDFKWESARHLVVEPAPSPYLLRRKYLWVDVDYGAVSR